MFGNIPLISRCLIYTLFIQLIISMASSFTDPESPFEFLLTQRPPGLLPAHSLGHSYEEAYSHRASDVLIQLTSSLRSNYRGYIVTTITAANVNLLGFASAGNAHAELDNKNDEYYRFRYLIHGDARQGTDGHIIDSVKFARYKYTWLNEEFILYAANVGYSSYYFVLKKPADDETTQGISKITDNLIKAVGEWMKPDQHVVCR
jgi:hypothetical protein